MSDSEVRSCFETLLGEDFEQKLPAELSAREFAEDILGFEDYTEMNSNL